ncbi:MAG: FliM/FliN family flagellar motor switch protein [Legionellales bacterium]|nr:FliM/FliN family flagellar motor switch protein [Legionellales bacterium]
MDDLLSNEEIDALTANNDGDSLVRGGVEDNFELVDFTNAHNKTLMSFPGFNSLNEVFALEAGTALSKFLRRPLTVTARAPKLMTYSDYIASIEYPTSFNLIEFSNQHSMAFVQVSAGMLAIFINYLFGGMYADEVKVSKQFGKMEERITCRIINTILDMFVAVWRDIEPFVYTILQPMLKPNPINLLNETDRLLICGYTIRLEQKQLYFELALEASLLERLKPAIRNSSLRNINVKEERVWRKKLYENVLDIEFELLTRFPYMKIKFEELVNLKVGDVIALDNPTFVNVFLDDMKVYHASCGSANGSRVIEILEQIKL